MDQLGQRVNVITGLVSICERMPFACWFLSERSMKGFTVSTCTVDSKIRVDYQMRIRGRLSKLTLWPHGG